MYKLIAVSDSSKVIKGGQSRDPTSADVFLDPSRVTFIGRAGSSDDYKIPVEQVQYSSKHCNVAFRKDVCFFPPFK